MNKTKIKPLVFWPPFLLCVATVATYFLDENTFIVVTTNAYQWTLDTFGWLVSLLAFSMFALCVIIFPSPLGRVVLGGPGAKPLLTRWQMFAVVLTTNIAIGVIFWAPIEPLHYLTQPPKNVHAAPNSPEAALFAISTVYLHWSFTPYAIAATVGMMFALGYYNMKKPFSLGAPLAPLLGRYGEGIAAQLIDTVCLYCLVAAMAAALSGVAMLLGGGINHVLGIEGRPSDLLLAVLMAAIMGASVAAAISGLTKGIRKIANINTAFLFLLIGMVLFLGPTRFIVNFAVEGFGYFLNHYFEKVLFTGAAHQETWPRQWTQMQYSAWFAWAPIMGVFLGRIAYGYTVRTFLFFNILLPSLFTGLWMAVFCGAVVHMEMFDHANLAAVLKNSGDECVLYAFLANFPLTSLLVPVLLVTGFLSFVTTADGNTDAMSLISTKGVSTEAPESGMAVKIVWGAVVAILAWIMATYAHLDGIRMLSNLGGLPALFLCLAVSVAAVRVMLNPARFNLLSETTNPTETRKSDGKCTI